MNPRRAGTAAARLHRMNRRNRGTEKAARFGQPPGVRDHGLPLADFVVIPAPRLGLDRLAHRDRKSTRLNSSHANISYAVFCLKKKTQKANSTCYHTQHT